MITVKSMIHASCRACGPQPALVFSEETLTYTQYWARIQQMGACLQADGLGPGDRIAVISRNTPEYLIAYGVAEVFGWVLVPVNFRLSAPEMAWILRDSGCRAVFVEATLLAASGEVLRQTVPGVCRWVAWRGSLPGFVDWASWMDTSVGEAMAWPVESHDIAYIIYTSGTTGRPKGALLPHQSQVANTLVMAGDLGLSGQDRVLLVMPLHHVGGKWLSLAALARGATLVIMPGFDLDATCDAIARYRITVTLLAPTMIYRLLAQERMDLHQFTSLQTLLYSSSPMAPDLLAEGMRALGPIFAQVYGSTESGSITWFTKEAHRAAIQEGDLVRLGSAGRPTMGTELMLLDPNQHVVEDGEGEICVQAPWVCAGYWRNPMATEQAFWHGWLRTGDVGRVDDDGFVYVLDRQNDLIISGGENIYPREVEDVLMAHPLVAEVAVVGSADAEWGQSVLAFVVPQAGANLLPEELMLFCQTRLARYKRPRAVRLVASLPRNSVGKVLRRALREDLPSASSSNGHLAAEAQ